MIKKLLFVSIVLCIVVGAVGGVLYASDFDGGNSIEVEVVDSEISADVVRMKGDIIEFEDANLEAAIRDAIGKPEGDIYFSDVVELHHLDASERGIGSLEGIQYLVNLEWLKFRDNKVSDIEPLSDLTNLKELMFWRNEVTDISPLKNLINLERLDFGGNQVTDISSLENLENLGGLWCWGNQITDISSLGNLTNLVGMHLGGNQLTDISTLKNLTKLKYLHFGDNEVTDISALENLTSLEQLYFGRNEVTDIDILEILTNLKELFFDRNQVTDISALVDNQGLESDDTIDMRYNHLDLAPGSENMQDIETLIDRGVVVEYEPQDGIVEFEDENLEAAVREAIDKPEGDIYLSDVEEMYHLDASHRGIESLEGIQYLVNLEWLNLNSNQLTDIGPLNSLTSLADLDLGDNQIMDIKPLSALTALEFLQIHWNQINDLSPLSPLTNLWALAFEGNHVDDLEPIEGLTNLRHLCIDDTQVSDLSPLAGLINLERLCLRNNEIKDIDALEDMTNMEQLYFGDNEVTNINALENLTGLRELFFDRNQVTDISALVDNTGLKAGDEIDMRYNYLDLTPGSDNMQDIQTLLDRGVSVEYEPQDGIVEFEDENLEAAVREAIGKPEGDIYFSDVVGLHHLDASERGIESLEGIQYLVNMEWLKFRDNNVSDIEPLSDLTNLKELMFWNNEVTDISPLKNLTNLEHLDFGGNQVTDISSLENLENLELIWCWGNQITDIDVLENLANLKKLNLHSNQVTNITPLSNLINLQHLRFSDNQVSDISTLQYLINLRHLDFGSNKANDISPLSDLTNLYWLEFADNEATNIEALSNLTNLTDLRFWDNQVKDISVLQYLTDLRFLWLDNNQVDDISALKNLTKLEELYFGGNQVEDIGVLENLTNLVELWFDRNQVSDISPLVDNDGWESGDYIDMRYNYLDLTPGSENIQDIETLIDRGVVVEYEPQDGIVEFEDENLEAAVREAIDKPEGDIYLSDVEEMYRLDASERGIESLEGIQYLVNLEWLDFFDNEISEILPLASLTNLEGLWFGDNEVGDISPLANLTNLKWLCFTGNEVSDISPLANLTNLKTLNFWGNRVSEISTLVNFINLEELWFVHNEVNDISPLANLTNLEHLDFFGNQVSDISPVANLTNLEGLNFGDNEVGDISPLANLTNLQWLNFTGNEGSDISPLANLTNLKTLNFCDNGVSDISTLTNLTNLEKLWFGWNEVSDISPLAKLSNLKRLYFWDNGVSDISPLSNLTNLHKLRFGGNEVSDLTPLSELINVNELYFQGNQVTDISSLVDNEGFGSGDYIDMRYNHLDLTPGSDSIRDIETLIDRGVEVEYEPQDGIVEFEDENLEAAIRDAIGKPEGDIYLSDVADLHHLDAYDREIESLEGIQYLVNLEWLNFGGNQVSDISPLSNLTNLRALWFHSNEVSDVSPLENLPNLKGLSFWDNEVSDISPLANLTNLRGLSFGVNQVSDVSPLSNLTNLERLYFVQNNVSDISPVANLTNLHDLRFGDNEVSDLTPLSELIHLRELYLWGNQISDISSVAYLTNLKEVGFWDNEVSDISPLSNLTNLEELYFGYNQVSDVSPLLNLTNLERLYFVQNNVSDISPVANLTNLHDLRFGDNEVSDLTPLSELIHLRELYLQGNQVKDISPLVDNDGFGSGDYIDMRYNYLDLTPSSENMQDIETLIDRGVEIEYEPQQETYSVTFIVTADETALRSPRGMLGEELLEGAEVELNGKMKTTDANGEAVFKNVAPGEHAYTVSKEGYTDAAGTVHVVETDIIEEVQLASDRKQGTFLFTQPLPQRSGEELEFEEDLIKLVPEESQSDRHKTFHIAVKDMVADGLHTVEGGFEFDPDQVRIDEVTGVFDLFEANIDNNAGVVVFGGGFVEPEQGVLLGEIITVQATALQAGTNSVFELSIEQALAAPDGTAFMPEELRSADVANHLLGDVDHSGDVMAGDAVETLRYVLDVQTMGPVDVVLADFDNDLTLLSGDAVNILRRVLGIHSGERRRRVLDEDGRIYFEPTPVKAAPGEQVVFHLAIEDIPGEGLDSITGSFTFDPDVLEVDDVTAEDLDLLLPNIGNDGGTVGFGGGILTPQDGIKEGHVLEITATANEDAEDSSPLVLSLDEFRVFGIGDYLESLKISDGEFELDIESYRVTFKVVDRDGEAVEGAEVDLDGEITMTDGNGEAVFEDVTPGAYPYTVSKDEYLPYDGTVEVVDADVTEEVALSMVPYHVTFIVTDEEDEAIEGAEVDLDGEVKTTDADGEAVFSVEPGEYAYTVSRAGYATEEGTVEVVDQDTTEEVALSVLTFEARFRYEPETVIRGTSISFIDESVSDTEIVEWSWEFGDGNTSDEQNPTHTYSRDLELGTYTVRLTVTDELGEVDQATRDIEVEKEPEIVEVKMEDGVLTIIYEYGYDVERIILKINGEELELDPEDAYEENGKMVIEYVFEEKDLYEIEILIQGEHEGQSEIYTTIYKYGRPVYEPGESSGFGWDMWKD